MSRVALLFHTAALVTLVSVSIVWRRSGNPRQPDAEIDDESMLRRHNIRLAHTRNTLMVWVWRPSLAALAASLTGICLLVFMATRPFSSTIATSISLLLGGIGVLFALSNWVPYALIACEASAQARSRLLAVSESGATTDGDDIPMLPSAGADGPSDDFELHDDTPLLLAVHNMAITVPQIVASVASWVLMQLLALFGLEEDVIWVFALCVPPALCAACL